MDINHFLLVAFLFSFVILLFLVSKLFRVNTQLSTIKNALQDIKGGNLNRRILAGERDITKAICYDINEIAINSQTYLVQQKQAERAYKQLMTSLSHDVKTPLASLMGYLEAIDSKMVSGDEKAEYIRVALDKSHSLKVFVDSLFEWSKLAAGEQSFQFERYDLNELSRNILSDWITVLESNGFEYEIEIPECECYSLADKNAFARILNNLLQNAITHSGGSKLRFSQNENDKTIVIRVADNGSGISESDLPRIFERLYKCDNSRSVKGNGLGLSITKELIAAHKGRIRAESTIGTGTTFIIELPKET